MMDSESVIHCKKCMAHIHLQFEIDERTCAACLFLSRCKMLTVERDRLAAENAELRKCAKGFKRRHNTIAKKYWETCAELTTANATLDEERSAYAVLLESHEIILDALTESDATLDAYEKRIAELTAELNAAKLIILDDSNSKLAIDRLKAKIPPPFERGDHVWHDAVEIMEDAQLILYPEAFSDDPL